MSKTALIKYGQLIQAPLAGYSCSAMRRLPWVWGGVSACCTEMLSASTFVQNNAKNKRYRDVAIDEGPLWVQLSATHADDLARATAEVATWKGVTAIDLNCGCPKTKIRKKKCGSRLLADSNKIASFVRVMREHTDLPVLIKMRVDADSGDQYNRDVALAAQDAGASAITVHGRHWTHDYTKAVCYADIAMIKQTVTIPVIGNGDVDGPVSAMHMFQATQCDAVMVGRAAVGQPWLFAHISAVMAGQTFEQPAPDLIADILIRHVSDLAYLLGPKTALLQARKLAHYYHRHADSSHLVRAVIACVTLDDFVACVKPSFHSVV